MNKIILLFLFVIGLIAFGAARPAHADNGLLGLVTSACGTPPRTYTAGTNAPILLDTTGNFCTNATGGGGGGTSSNFGAAFPSAGTAIGVTDGTLMRAITGINYTGSSYAAATEIFGTLPAFASTPTVIATQATGANLHVACDSGCSSSSAPADEAAFTPGTTSQTPVGGFFQTTATNNALTTGQMGAFQVTANRALFTNLRNSSGTEIATAGAPLQVSLANTAANATAVSTNTAQVNGIAVLTGAGASGTGAQRVTVSQDSTTVAGSSSLPAGTNIIGKVGIDQTTPGTTNAVSVAQFGATNISTGTGAGGAGIPRVTVSNDSTVGLVAGSAIVGKVGIDQTTDVTTNGVEIAPTAASAATPSTYVSTALESNHAVKASAGNLYRVYAFSAVVGYVMVFNATAAPADGAVTPAECVPIPANGWISIDKGDLPENYGTGISIALSTTGCFTKTASANAMFRVAYK